MKGIKDRDIKKGSKEKKIRWKEKRKNKGTKERNLQL
jgi:hypothetical protein